MYSVLLIDADPTRAFDLYIRLEDAGFNVLGPISSTSEGFRELKGGELDGIIINVETARRYFPELYSVVIESDIPLIFLDSDSKTKTKHQQNGFLFKSSAPISEIKSYLDVSLPTSIENNFMIPGHQLDAKTHH